MSVRNVICSCRMIRKNIRCQAEKQDQKTKRLKKAGTAGGILLGVGAGAVAIVKNGKEIIKIIAKLK